MSYARAGVDGSDVYVYVISPDGREVWICQWCKLLSLAHPDDNFQTHIASGMLAHLQAHRDAGHTVPDYALERLREEIHNGSHGPKQGDPSLG